MPVDVTQPILLGTELPVFAETGLPSVLDTKLPLNTELPVEFTGRPEMTLRLPENTEIPEINTQLPENTGIPEINTEIPEINTEVNTLPDVNLETTALPPIIDEVTGFTDLPDLATKPSELGTQPALGTQPIELVTKPGVEPIGTDISALETTPSSVDEETTGVVDIDGIDTVTDSPLDDATKQPVVTEEVVKTDGVLVVDSETTESLEICVLAEFSAKKPIFTKFRPAEHKFANLLY